MLDKDRAALEKSMCKDAYLYHLTGRRQSREEYIRDIQNGTLNYYDYRIEEADAEKVKVRLMAKVYGGGKSWWTLLMSVKYGVEDGLPKIKECKVRIG